VVSAFLLGFCASTQVLYQRSPGLRGRENKSTLYISPVILWLFLHPVCFGLHSPMDRDCPTSLGDLFQHLAELLGTICPSLLLNLFSFIFLPLFVVLLLCTVEKRWTLFSPWPSRSCWQARMRSPSAFSPRGSASPSLSVSSQAKCSRPWLS